MISHSSPCHKHPLQLPQYHPHDLIHVIDNFLPGVRAYCPHFLTHYFGPGHYQEPQFLLLEYNLDSALVEYNPLHSGQLCYN